MKIDLNINDVNLVIASLNTTSTAAANLAKMVQDQAVEQMRPRLEDADDEPLSVPSAGLTD